MGDWLSHWIATRDRAAGTVRGYTGHVRLYLTPYLGKLLLCELSLAHVQAMFTAIARHHEALGKPTSPATLIRTRATLRTAQEWGTRKWTRAASSPARTAPRRIRRT
ncbi:hypothetical protein OHR68_06485 [Spirillospora sp. NBC_00431]